MCTQFAKTVPKPETAPAATHASPEHAAKHTKAKPASAAAAAPGPGRGSKAPASSSNGSGAGGGYAANRGGHVAGPGALQAGQGSVLQQLEKQHAEDAAKVDAIRAQLARML